MSKSIEETQRRFEEALWKFKIKTEADEEETNRLIRKLKAL